MSETERDELAEVIRYGRGEDASVRPCECDIAVADAILAAGYRRPRTVTTPDELYELQEGSLLLSCSEYPRYAGTVWRISSGGMLEQVGREVLGVTPLRYFKDPLPATVLHEPEAGK